MELIRNIKESDSIVIEGEKKVGKMTLAFYLSKQIAKHVTFISPLASTKILRKVESSISSFGKLEDLDEFLTIFSFREDWMNIKIDYGYKYFLKDLEYFISHQENEVMIFHRVEAFFEYADRDFLEDFLAELLSYGMKYKKKLIFTLNTEDYNYDLLRSYLVDNCDFYLKLDKEDSVRNIDVLYSLTPLTNQTYIFENSESGMILEPKLTFNGLNKYISIVVISADKDIQRIHKYLLNKDDIELTIANDIGGALEAVLKNPDYLIFNQEDEKIALSICELSKKYKLKTQILYLVNKDFVRVDDRMKAKTKGCIDMLKLDKNIMNYILELEKYFDLVFYKNYSHITDSIYKDKNEFKKEIQEILDNRGIFSLIKLNETLSEEDMSAIREYDKILIDGEYSFLFMLNSLKFNIENILKNKFKRELNIVKIQDSLDIFFGEKLCID